MQNLKGLNLGYRADRSAASGLVKEDDKKSGSEHQAAVTWPAGADGVVVGRATVRVVPAEPGADRQALPLKSVAVLRLRTIRVAHTFWRGKENRCHITTHKISVRVNNRRKIHTS